MLAKFYIIEKKGSTSGIMGIIPGIVGQPDRDITNDRDREKQSILTFLRYDLEKNQFGGGGPENNPSKDPNSVKFFYSPFMYKQELAKYIPYKVSEHITLIDSFVCLGSRFKLDSLQVIVEVYESNCGNNRIWAEVYYVADCEIPACIITANLHIITLENENISR